MEPGWACKWGQMGACMVCRLRWGAAVPCWAGRRRPTQTARRQRSRIAVILLSRTQLQRAPRPPATRGLSDPAASAAMLRGAQRLASSLLVQLDAACSSGSGWEALQRAGISGTASAARRLYPPSDPVRPKDGESRIYTATAPRGAGLAAPPAAAAAACRHRLLPLTPGSSPDRAADSGVERPYLVDKVRIMAI